MRIGYYQEGFLTLQRAIDCAIMLELNKSADVHDKLVYLNGFPEPAKRSDPIIRVINDFFPVLTLISFVILCASVAKEIVLEKERKIKVGNLLLSLNHISLLACIKQSCAYLNANMRMFTCRRKVIMSG